MITHGLRAGTPEELMDMGDGATWLLVIVLLLAALGLLGLAVLPGPDRDGEPPVDPARLRAEAEELAGHAEAVRAEAERAVAAALAARDRVGAAEQDRDRTWQAQEAAEAAYQRAWRAALASREPRDTDDTARDRERTVTRAALSAYRRGDLSGAEFREVWRRAGEPDPVQQAREQVVERYRAELIAARRAYDRAAAAFRHLDEAARIAEVAARALVDEAAESAVEAEQARIAAHRYPDRWFRRRKTAGPAPEPGGD
ncbi:hypothetical protein [Micromonospora echinofusca]|uniref:Colicin import membrane protein n=1 Tax=Micromonospora echinofusca TaxID=47858 RepID=A0ABS3VXC7_MICEH|nr:hypothetical protein [Micromonospora echinofusca]MBO4209185.1 hypothetical protein [Micromonospora echinofusca]